MYNKIISILKKWKYIFLFFFLFIIVFSQRFLNNVQNGLVDSVSSDGISYYAYLPASIIFNDFDYKYYINTENKIDPRYNPFPTELQNRKQPTNKYFCGTAICLLPFFLISILISAIAGTDINGYTDTFLMMVSLSPIFYYLLATFLFTRIARFFKVPELCGFWLSLIFFFTTNLFHYVVQEPSMSHAYSFFAITLFFHVFTLFIQQQKTKNIVLLAFSLGLVVLIRPPNILVILFIPFFFSTIKECGLFFKECFTKHLLGLILGVLVFMVCAFIQLFFYYLQTGDFIVEFYPGETFNFLKPEIFNIFLSYKKGLFLYTPIIAFLLLFIVIGKTMWYKRIVFILTFFVFTYITASWWCWYYGGGFSGRTFIDIYPIFIITLIVIFIKLNVVWKRLLIVGCMPFIFFNQLMAFQYSHLIIDAGNMDEKKYWEVFLETDLGKINNSKKHKLVNNKTILKSDSLTFENSDQNEVGIAPGGYNSYKASIIGENNAYSPGFIITLRDIGIEYTSPFYVIVECAAKTSNEDKRLSLVVSVFEEGYCSRWESVYQSQFKEDENGWIKMINIIKINANEMTEKNVIKLFAVNEFGYNLVDNIKYTIVKE